jgi:hypothetical protein
MRAGIWGIGLAVLALFIGACAGAQRHEGVLSMTVYYFPIAAETLTPITSANIQERGKRCEIQSAKDIGKIRDALRAASSPTSQNFSDKAVRVKILDTSSAGDGLSAVVEKEGEVRFSNGKEAQISHKGLETITKIIESKCKP